MSSYLLNLPENHQPKPGLRILLCVFCAFAGYVGFLEETDARVEDSPMNKC